MKNKEMHTRIDVKIYIIIYMALVISAICNMIICRLAYGFFGINSGVIASFFNSIVIIFAIIFLALRNMMDKKNIFLFKILGVITIIIYPIVITISQLFSLFEFQGIIFDISKFSMFKDTYIFFNIPLFLVILIASSRFQKIID